MKYALVITCILVTLFACKPKNTVGLGGVSNTVIIFPQQHGRAINNCSAFFKFNTQDEPGTDTTAYDARFKGDQHTNYINCAGFNNGKYYVYVYGWDTLINQPVHGGLPIDITTTSNLVVPISE